jgi:hypothetical protein
MVTFLIVKAHLNKAASYRLRFLDKRFLALRVTYSGIHGKGMLPPKNSKPAVALIKANICKFSSTLSKSIS